MCIKSSIVSTGQLFGLTDNALKRDFQNARARFLVWRFICCYERVSKKISSWEHCWKFTNLGKRYLCLFSCKWWHTNISTGAVISGRYISPLIYLICNHVIVLKWAYTVWKPCLKGENTNITKNDLKLISHKILISFKKLKNLLRWNILKQHAQWFSCKVALSYFNKIRTSKICSMVKRLSHPMHIGVTANLVTDRTIDMCMPSITLNILARHT